MRKESLQGELSLTFKTRPSGILVPHENAGDKTEKKVPSTNASGNRDRIPPQRPTDPRPQNFPDWDPEQIANEIDVFLRGLPRK